MQKKISKKLLTKFVEASKEKKQISQNRVTMIANSMNRSQLKQFIKALQNDMLSSTVYVDTAFPLSKIGQNQFENMYEQKDVVFSVNPQILLGCKVTNNDLVYEGDLKSRLTEILEGVKNDAAN